MIFLVVINGILKFLDFIIYNIFFLNLVLLEVYFDFSC